MNRKGFMKLSKGIIGGLAIPGAFGETIHAAASEKGEGAVLDDSYLVKGLTGMARANGWFDAHWGACVLAGYYLCRENRLGEETTANIRKQLDAVIRLRAAQFEPLPEEAADETLIEKIPGSLAPAITGGLRAHGHAVIFTSLSTKALRDVPRMAQPALIQGICGLNRQIAKIKPQKPGDQPAYADTQEMIEATFDSLARFKDLLGRPSVPRPNFTHMITHTEALMNLEAMGYPVMARSGYGGHRVHIGAPVPEIDPTTTAMAERVTLEKIMARDYWENEENVDRWNRRWDVTNNRNGDWVADGHLFKVLYSYHRLISRIKDRETVRLCSMILLERYFNPDVQGG
ncbi:MAG: hypothetical protein K9M45_11030 [Kiritimatiellales bacterium]|nr:hypothetical protein [Kiritimatiellales bacterium]